VASPSLDRERLAGGQILRAPVGSGNAPKRPGKRAPVRHVGPTRTGAPKPVTPEAELKLLRRQHRETLAQQAAVAEVLKTISRSAFDLQPILDIVIESTTRLCKADWGFLDRLEGQFQRRVAVSANAPAAERATVGQGTTISPWNFGRAILQRGPVTEADYLNDPDVPDWVVNWSKEHPGQRMALGVPLFRAEQPIGVMGLWRADERRFTAREIALVETFADQAAIAIENVRLLTETKEALERQTAVSDILRVISASPTDIQPVLEAIAESASKVAGAEDVSVYIVRGDQGVSSSHRGPIDMPSSIRIDASSVTGRAIVERRVVHVADVRATDEYPRSKEASLREDGQRAVLSAPLLRDGVALGAIVFRRREPQPFSDRQIELVQTFAGQAVIAIENVRLFNETKEALERQTATSEVLKVISRSAFDLQRVLDTVIESATTLTHASAGTIWRLEGEAYRVAASSFSIPDKAMNETLRRRASRPQDQDTVLTRAARSRRPVQVEDVQADPGYRSSVIRDIGLRTGLAVPLLREGVPIGVLVIGRQQVSPFTEKEIELAANFADQAVIAIENTRLLNEIQDKSRQLAAASRHKTEFMANMSHELRTPLNAIIGFSDVLEQRLFGELNEKQADYTRDIASSGRHLLDLVNEILDLSKVEAGRMELEPSEFVLADTIHIALGFVRERAASHRIELTAEVPTDLGTIVADERKIRQVLLNLLSNAVKFTPDGGTISVRANRGVGEVAVAVQDTGIGIAPEDQAKVFDEFQQVGKASDRSREGTGLGLTLAKRFIELHGGRIWVASEVGRGTTFTFAIPGRGAAPIPS
jgi:signal transduction histidine kinase